MQPWSYPNISAGEPKGSITTSWVRAEGVEEEVGEAVAAEAVGAQGQTKMGAVLAKNSKSGRRQVTSS